MSQTKLIKYRYQTACYQGNALISLHFRTLYSPSSQSKKAQLLTKALASASLQPLEAEWKLHNGSRPEKIEQAAISLAVSPAEATTTALGKKAELVTPALCLHHQEGFEKKPRSTVDREE